MKEGKLIIISAPSGSGKTTIAKSILQKYPQIIFSISATTRPIRAGEKDGKDYYFLSKEKFLEKQSNGDLVEWEEIFGNYYGTLKSEVEKVLFNKKVMLFDVDVKGALSIRKNFPNQSVLIFIRPPSIQVLKERLEKRNTENFDVLSKRLSRVPMELEQGAKFDYQIINDDLSKAINEVDEIVKKYI